MPTLGKISYWLDEPVMVLRRATAEERTKWEKGADPWWVRPTPPLPPVAAGRRAPSNYSTA